jgi:hypothetical protein
MREFVAELYLPAGHAVTAVRLAGVADQTAGQLTGEGTRVQLMRSIFIPQDETCIHLYSAESREAVQLLAVRAALPLDRISDAVSWPPDESACQPDEAIKRSSEGDRGTT